MLFSVLFIIILLLDVERCSASASSLRCSSRSPRTGVAPLSSFHHWLVSTGFLAVALSLILSSETLCGRLHLPGCLACTSNTSTQHCALRDRWLAVGARAPRSCSLQQRVLLTVTTGLRGRCRCGPSVVSNTTPTPLCTQLMRRQQQRQPHYDYLGCVHPHCEGLPLATAWSVGSSGTAGVSSILVSLSSGFCHWSCHCHTPLFFTCSDDFLSLSGHRHLLHNVIRTAGRCDCTSHS